MSTETKERSKNAGISLKPSELDLLRMRAQRRHGGNVAAYVRHLVHEDVVREERNRPIIEAAIKKLTPAEAAALEITPINGGGQ